METDPMNRKNTSYINKRAGIINNQLNFSSHLIIIKIILNNKILSYYYYLHLSYIYDNNKINKILLLNNVVFIILFGNKSHFSSLFMFRCVLLVKMTKIGDLI